jgi:hypothetical protein
MHYFYPILSRFSDEMGVGGGGGPTPSFLDPSMFIYYSQSMIHFFAVYTLIEYVSSTLLVLIFNLFLIYTHSNKGVDPRAL